MMSDAVYEHGVVVDLKAWSELGHLEMELLPGGEVRRTLSHRDGAKAVEGLLVDRVPHGTWTEWDAAGEVVGRVEYVDGVAGELEGTSRLVLHADELDFMITATKLELPTAMATEVPQLAVNVVLLREQVVVDGVHVLDLTQAGAIDDSDLRGSMIPKLHEQLLDKADQARAIGEVAPDYPFTGRLLLQVDTNTPWTVLRPVLWTAGQAQFSAFQFMVKTGLQWPPREGPVQGDEILGVVTVSLPMITTEPPPPWPVVTMGESFALQTGTEGVVLPDLPALVAHMASVPGPVVVVVPAPESTFGEVIAVLDALHASHPERILGGGHEL